MFRPPTSTNRTTNANRRRYNRHARTNIDGDTHNNSSRSRHRCDDANKFVNRNTNDNFYADHHTIANGIPYSIGHADDAGWLRRNLAIGLLQNVRRFQNIDQAV